MHLLTLTDPVTLGPGATVAAGEYLVDDCAGAQLLVMAGGGKMETPSGRFFTPSANPTAILFMRMGGFGDLVLLTPVLRECKRRWPHAKIGVSTMSFYSPALENLPFVDEILPYPMPVARLDEFDSFVMLENAVEKNPNARQLHMAEVFAQVAGLDSVADMKPAYGLRAEEGVWAASNFPRTIKRRVCIQVVASGRCRTYPRQQTAEVAMGLANRGWEVFLMGKPGDIPPNESPKWPAIKNLIYQGHTFRQSCAILAQSDCVLGPDSALIHVAGALGVPAFGLYGPFPWQLRTAHSPSITAISGVGPCAPCHHHENAALRNYFPSNCPSAAKGYCGVLADIKVERIVAKVDAVERVG